MKVQVNKKDAFWSYMATFLSMGASVLLVPAILFFLNDNDTAVYYIFSSLSGIAVLFDFGFSPSIARSMTYAWSGAKSLSKEGADKSEDDEPNYSLMTRVVKSCKIIYFILALVAFLLCISLGTVYVRYITRDNGNVSYLISWFVYAIAIFFNIYYSYFSVFLRGVGAIAKVNMAMVVSKLTQMGLCILLLIMRVGIFGVSIAYLMYGMVFRLLAKKWFLGYQGIGDRLKTISSSVRWQDVIEIIKTIWPNAWKDGVVTLSNYLLNQATTIIASLYLSLQQTGIYSLCVQLTSVIATVAATMYTVYQPALQSAYVNREKQIQKKHMSLIVVSYVGIFAVGMILMMFIGIPFVSWLKPNYQISIGMLWGVGGYQFLLKFRNCYTSYISTTNRLIYWKSFLVSAVICVALSGVFAGGLKMGVFGLLLGQIGSQLVYNAWHWPMIVHKELGLGVVEMVSLGAKSLGELLTNKNSRGA